MTLPPDHSPLRLIPATAEHAPLAFSWRKEADAARFNPLDAIGVEEFAARLRDNTTDFTRRPVKIRWMVEYGGVLVGTVSASPTWTQGYSEIGYQIAEQWRGQGLATRAVAGLLDLLFVAADLERVFATIHHENVPSMRVVERLGFVREGILREHYKIQGKRVDEVVYGLLRREWEARRGG